MLADAAESLTAVAVPPKYVQRATPRRLAFMDAPASSNPYRNEATMAGVQARSPGLDMTPWREAR
jgi:hypothetical protein